MLEGGSRTGSVEGQCLRKWLERMKGLGRWGWGCWDKSGPGVNRNRMAFGARRKKFLGGNIYLYFKRGDNNYDGESFDCVDLGFESCL